MQAFAKSPGRLTSDLQVISSRLIKPFARDSATCWTQAPYKTQHVERHFLKLKHNLFWPRLVLSLFHTVDLTFSSWLNRMTIKKLLGSVGSSAEWVKVIDPAGRVDLSIHVYNLIETYFILYYWAQYFTDIVEMETESTCYITGE